MAASCLDTGLPDYRMAMPVRAGLPSRAAARQVVAELNPSFLERSELRAWLNSSVVEELSQHSNWPSPETSNLWSVNGGVKVCHWGGAKAGQFGARALERAALI